MSGTSTKNMKIGPKLVLMFLIVGLAPFIVIGAISLNNASDALEKQAFNQLLGVREIKKKQIESFFAERQGDMGVLMETVSTLRKEALGKLSAVRQIKKNAIESYFDTIKNQVVTLSENKMIVSAAAKLRRDFKKYREELDIIDEEIEEKRAELKTYYTDQFAPQYASQNDGKTVDMSDVVAKLSANAVAYQHAYIYENEHPLGEKNKLKYIEDGSSYNTTHRRIHAALNSYLEAFGYYDIFIADSRTGEVTYSVFKELDFATSLKDGPWADSGLGEAYRQGMALENDKDAVFIDYKLYRPSYDAPAGFVASPIFAFGKKIGVLIFQLPLDRISEIMGERAGLGKSGETYLVGPDLLMRSDSYLDPKNHTVSASIRNPEKGKVDTDAGRDVVAGNTAEKVILDYNGNPVLSAYTPVTLGNLKWGLIAEIDVAEAFVPEDEKGTPFYKKYIDQYGYYDLFLMNPDGFVFYTVTKEADYQTNMVSGKYASSGLGKLTKQVLKSKKFGLADFAPYAPSKGDPAGFIAQPVINDGKVDVVVALQLSLEAINNIMQQRDGMGETGEAYLVGQDKLMRSDSFLDPEGHSVKASFAKPETGSVDTEGSRLALEGQVGERIIMDYNGNPVLSAFTSIKVGGTRWALLAEIDKAEAFASVDNLKTLMLIIGAVGLVLISIAGYFIAQSLSKPITNMTDSMGVLAGGDKTVEIPGVGRTDEIGDMASAVQVFKDNMIKADELAAEQERERAAKEKRAAVIEELLRKFNQEVDEALGVVASAATEMQASSQSLKNTADGASQRAGAAAAATEQASANVHSVATATEELTSSVAEINRQVATSEEISREAKSEADRTNELVQGLSESVGKIGEVVNLINDIADQTNLLALNATIEAARAGDAGKGFAVVASEVKNLASQTGKATEEIAAQITNVQTETSGAVNAIKSITDVIDKMSEISATIASALEEQSAATGEIARNVQEAASGTSEVAENVAQVNEAATETGEASGEVASAADDVAERAEMLRKQVDTFLESVRMA